MEEELRKVPAAEIVAGVGGLIAGLAVAALLSVPVSRLPPLVAWTTVAFTYVTLGSAGYRIGRTKHEDLFGLIGMKPRASGAIEDDDRSDVDAVLIRAATERGASLLTTDHNLSKVAEAVGVPVPRLNDLAAAFRLPIEIGDAIEVRLVKQGREAGQAVGYLDDGTIVVVEDAGEQIGSDAPIVVRNVITTATGMVFANLQ